MKYKAILFDMDGVLIESEWLMRDTSIQSLAEHGVQAKHEDFLEFTGCGEDRFIGGVAEKYGLTYTFAMK
ncbi:MAG: cytidine deaminase, partial [Clostridia bacterium]|nr:cytidine deaminase [Clostridia bacterium]